MFINIYHMTCHVLLGKWDDMSFLLVKFSFILKD